MREGKREKERRKIKRRKKIGNEGDKGRKVDMQDGEKERGTEGVRGCHVSAFSFETTHCSPD